MGQMIIKLIHLIKIKLVHLYNVIGKVELKNVLRIFNKQLVDNPIQQ